MTTLYAALENSLAVVHGQNGAWVVEKAQTMESIPECVAVDPLHPNLVYCGTSGHGLWCSMDAGRTWQRAGDGIASSHITSVAVSLTEQVGGQSVVYAGTEPSAFYRSEDGGQSWHDCVALRQLPSAPTWSFPPRPYTSHVRWITPDPLVPGRIFAAIEAGALLRSLDGGLTWEDRKPDGPYDTHTLIMHRQAPDQLYSAAGDGFMQPGNGFLSSSDGGETWQRPDDGLHHHYLWGAAADPTDPTMLIISAANGPGQAHSLAIAESALYRKAGSAPWQEVRNGLPANKGSLAWTLASHNAEPGVFYAGNNQGIFRSADAGINWEALPIHWPDGLTIGRISAIALSSE